MSRITIGFLGSGHMARAIISGLLADDNQTYTNQNIIASCRSTATAKQVKTQFNIECRQDNQWLVAEADVIILSVKPQQMTAILAEISDYNLDEKIIITLAAGLSSSFYRTFIGEDLPLLRAMPNIAASVNASLTGIYTDQELSSDDEYLIESIFAAVGEIAWLDDEVQVDGITAIAGSGIAYFFRFMEAIAKAGEQYGFEHDEIYDLVTLTAMGAATLALENDAEQPDFSSLCRQVAVEGGTTAEAIAVFNQAKLNDTTAEAMDAVMRRSAEMQQTIIKE